MTDKREQNHEVMRAAAQTAVRGPAASSVVSNLAALGVPGGEPHPIDVSAEGEVHEPIPGERDPETLPHREPGAIGRSPADDAPNAGAGVALTDDEIEELRRDAGGVPTHKK